MTWTSWARRALVAPLLLLLPAGLAACWPGGRCIEDPACAPKAPASAAAPPVPQASGK